MFSFNDLMSNGYDMDFSDTLHASFAMADFVYSTRLSSKENNFKK